MIVMRGSSSDPRNKDSHSCLVKSIHVGRDAANHLLERLFLVSNHYYTEKLSSKSALPLPALSSTDIAQPANVGT